MKARLQDLLTEQASRRADDAAIVFKGRATTYAELHESSNRVARALQDAGCREGDRVALLLPKSPDALIAMPPSQAKSVDDYRLERVKLVSEEGSSLTEWLERDHRVITRLRQKVEVKTLT